MLYFTIDKVFIQEEEREIAQLSHC